MKTVVTHSGSFHPDDVLAVATIMHLEGKENVQVVRSREQADWVKGDWVVDVGGVYDPETLRFDHHQPGAPVRENGIGYAAFGLVWRHHGEEVTGSKEIAERVEEKIALPIDAGDVGTNIYEINDFGVQPLEFFNVISSYSPPWKSDLDVDEQFLKAVDFAYDFLKRMISKYRAEAEMEELAKKLSAEVDENGVVVSEEKISQYAFVGKKNVVVVVCPRSDGTWSATLVPIDPSVFKYNKYFPESWASLVDEELEKASGIEGSVMCHKSRFMYIGKTKEAALKATEFLK